MPGPDGKPLTGGPLQLSADQANAMRAAAKLAVSQPSASTEFTLSQTTTRSPTPLNSADDDSEMTEDQKRRHPTRYPVQPATPRGADHANVLLLWFESLRISLESRESFESRSDNQNICVVGPPRAAARCTVTRGGGAKPSPFTDRDSSGSPDLRSSREPPVTEEHLRSASN
jgi:hypothetical protein